MTSIVSICINVTYKPLEVVVPFTVSELSVVEPFTYKLFTLAFVMLEDACVVVDSVAVALTYKVLIFAFKIVLDA